jgi:gamma-glutamylcyclotransferase (GGCT)/AIG2-like uncharacterized protein YtfP
MEKKIKGIIVGLKRYQENSFLINLLSSDSMLTQAWLKSDSLHDKHYIGQAVVGRVYEFNQRFFIKIDCCEDNYLHLFWDDHEKLNQLQKILKQIALLPQNVEINDLYINFLNLIKLMLRNEQEAINFWDQYYLALLND